MALIVCRKCGNKVSTTAIKCPRCGTPPHTREAAPIINQTAAARPQPVKASAPASTSGNSIVDQVIKIARAYRVDQLTPRQIAAGVAAIVMAWWIFFSIPASPSFAIYTFYRNVKAHDGAAAATFIDFPTLTKGVMDDEISAEAAQKNSDPSAEILGRGLLGLMSGAIADTAKARFQRMVEGEAGDDEKFTMSFGEMLGSIWYLQREGDIAKTRFKDQDGNVIEVKFVRQSDTGWRVSTIGGPGFRKMLRDQQEKQRKGGPSRLPVSPDSKSEPNV